MNLALERRDGKRPGIWYTLIGLLLLPAMIGGLLLWSFHNPTDRLHDATAAIVNNDQPVKVNGTTTPLGRQLAATLVDRSSTGKLKNDNYTWVVTDKNDASNGLADGTYAAVVTIPKGFSKAATSSQDASSARTATIDVQTSDTGGATDPVIGAVITRAAAQSFGQEVSRSYLDNVYVGFNTIHDRVVQASNGAADLADGATRTNTGAQQLSSGITSASSGSQTLASGLATLTNGTSSLASGAQQTATGAAQVSDGSTQLASGLDQLADGAAQTNTGAQQVASGNALLNKQVQGAVGQFDELTKAVSDAPSLKQSTAQLAAGTKAAQEGSATVAAGADQTATGLAALAAACSAQGGSEQYCAQVAAAASGARDVADGATQTATAATTINEGAQRLASSAPALQDGASTADTQFHKLADATSQLATGSAQVAEGTAQVAAGSSTAATQSHALADGAAQVSDGAAQVSDGAAQVNRGAQSVRDGAVSLRDGLAQLDDGGKQVASGTKQVSDGAHKLDSGLSEAKDQVPTYTKAERTKLADAVSNPVAVSGAGLGGVFASTATPLLAAVALWIGAIAMFLLFRPVSRIAIASSASLARLMTRTGAPAALLGAAQGLIITVIAELVLRLSPGALVGFGAIAILAGAVFMVVVQSITALLGGTGRFIAAIAAVVAVGGTVFSTAPGIIGDIAAILPTGAAVQALTAIVSGVGSAGTGFIGLLVWAVIGLVLSAVAVNRARTTTAARAFRPRNGLAGA